MDRPSERHRNQNQNDVDDIEDFEGESQPISTSQYPLAIKVPLRSEHRLMPAAPACSTPMPQQGIPPQSSGKRKGFYDGIDPDLFALADANEMNGTKKKPKMGFFARDSLSTPREAGKTTEDDITPARTGKGLPAPKPGQRQEAFEFPTPTPQTQFNKSRGFVIDPDLLAAAFPVKEKPQHAIKGLKPSTSQPISTHDSSSRVLWPTESFRNTPQQMTKHNPVPSDDIVPETSPPSTPPPPQNQPLLNDDSQVSIIDSIEDLVSPTKSKNRSPKTEDLDVIHSDIDITSSPPLSPLSPHPFKSKHINDDGSVSGDSLPDPDLMTLDNPITPLPIHKRLLRELIQQPPMTPTPQTPRPGYFNIHDLQKSIIIPKTEPTRAPASQHRRYSPGGLADTVFGWRKELHSTSVFKQRVQPIGVDYAITVIEVVQDGDMIIIKGDGEEGIERAIISGSARLGLRISVGQVVRYGRPWVVVKLLEEEWKCLMGKVEVQERDEDVDMG